MVEVVIFKINQNCDLHKPQKNHICGIYLDYIQVFKNSSAKKQLLNFQR